MALAESCISTRQIGELTIRQEDYNGLYFDYIVTEYLDGVEAGTSMAIACTAEGEVLSCVVLEGSLFTGRAAPASHQDSLISEEEATALAAEAFEATWGLKGFSQEPVETSCELHTKGGTQYYRVTLTYVLLNAQGEMPANPEDRTLSEQFVDINAQTGEVIQVPYSYSCE